MPDLTAYAACPTCGRPYDPPADPTPPRDADPSPWTWLPNADMTRLHACHEGERYVWQGEQRAAAACGQKLPAPTVALSGDMPPKCKRCLAVVEAGEVSG